MSDNRSEDPKYVRWAKAVKVRDSYCCQMCGISGEYKIQMDAHHMNSWDIFEFDRYNIQNGITLCQNCHTNIYHKLAGFGKNTKEHFEEFIKYYKCFKNVLDNDVEFQKTLKIINIFKRIIEAEENNTKKSSEVVTDATTIVSENIINQEDEPNNEGEQ